MNKTHKLIVRCITLIAVLIATYTLPSYATTTLYVTTDGTDSADGTSWATSTSLTNALAICTDSNEIWVAEGIYTNSAAFSVGEGCTIYGGFTNGMLTRAERDWDEYPTVLDGQGANVGIVSVMGGNVTLDGLVISNSTCGVNQYSQGFSAVDKRVAGDLTLANCRLVDHSNAGRYVGGVAAYFKAGSVLMTNCVVSGNTKMYRDAYAVAVVSWGADLEIVDSLFTNNSGLGLDGIRSTSLYFTKGKLNVLRTDFIDDQLGKGAVSGGAVYLGNDSTSSATFTNCLFRGNAGAYEGKGGAMWVEMNASRSVKLVNCTVTGNSRDNLSAYGGGIYVSSGILDVHNSIVWGNSLSEGSQNGLDIYNNDGSCTISYSQLSGIGLPYISGSVTLNACATGDPLFASSTDLHLRSKTGRWDPAAAAGNGAFVTTDTSYSTCLDAGDPGDPVGDEVSPNGNRVNMGRYGGTFEASKSAPNSSPLLEDHGAVVNFNRAKISGELTNSTYVTATVGLCYGTSSIAGEMTNGWEYVDQFNTSQHTGDVLSVWTPALTANTTYYYRWYATNSEGSDWTTIETFDTLSVSPGGGPDVLHVDQAATAGANDGTDWANAYLNVLEASIAVSGTRTNIWVTGGTYKEGAVVFLSANTRLIGGFEGTESAVLQRQLKDSEGTVTNYTVLDGEAQYRSVVQVIGADVTLDTIEIANSTGGEVYGTRSGLAKKVAGALTLSNCRIVGHTSGERNADGLGAYFSDGTVLMTNCLVANNSQSYRDTDGAGVYAGGADLVVVDCLFTNNGYLEGEVSFGTALCMNGGDLTVLRSEFSDNPGSHRGGGTVSLENGTGTSATFRSCLFRDNKTSTEGNGGALRINLPATGTATIDNCTFAGNTRDNADGLGGAIYLSGGTLNLRNSILWTNSVAAGSDNGQEIYVAGGTLNVSYCDLPGTTLPYVYGSGVFQNVITNDPLFADAPNGDYRLTRYSPCVNAGTNLTWITTTSVDLDGNPRRQGLTVDMGAYELPPPQGTLIIIQ